MLINYGLDKHAWEVSKKLYKERSSVLLCKGCYDLRGNCFSPKQANDEMSCCTVCCCRKLRLHEVKKRVRRNYDGARNKIIDIEDESKLSNIKKSTRFLSLYDLFTDVRYLYNVYILSMAAENQSNFDYKIATLIAFFAVISPFWISYSGLVQIQSKQNFSKNV